MADKTITQLTSATPASNDELAIWDSSAGATRKAAVSAVVALGGAMNINGLTAIDALAVGDELPVYDVSVSGNRKATGTQLKAFATNVDINSLTSATPATDDEVVIYDVSATGNRKATIAAVVALASGSSLNINGLTAIDALAAADELIVYDVSATANKKVSGTQLKAFATDVDINGLTSATPSTADTLAIYDVSATANRKTGIYEIFQLAATLSAETPASNDTISFYDVSASGSRKATIADILAVSGGININGLTAIDALATGDELPVYDVSVSANRKLTGAQLKAFATDVDINGLTSVTPTYDDYVVIYDGSAGGNRKATVVSLVNGLYVSELPATDVLAAEDVLFAFDASLSANCKMTGAQVKAFATDVDITGLTSATPATDDTLPIYDTSAGGNRKATVAQLLAPAALLAAANTFTENQTFNKADPTLTLTPSSGKATVSLAAADSGSSWGAVIGMGRNTNASTPAAGFVRMEDKGGQFYNVWPDDSGVLRIHTALPTNANDTAGTVVGAQTSSLDSKRLVGEVAPIDDVLAAVRQGAEAVRRFVYKSGAFGGEAFEGVVTDLAPRYGMDRDEEHPAGRSLNEITVIGDLLRAVVALDERLTALGG